MKIGAVSQLSGVSVRSIRHYHQLGLLEEPPRTTGGQRTYGVGDLVRVLHIRQLSDAGVPLATIPGVLDGTSDDPVTELGRLRRALDVQIETLALRRARLEVVSDRIEAGLTLGLLPTAVVDALEMCRADVADKPGVRRLLDREREMLELLALSAEFPAALVDAYAAIGADTRRRQAYLGILDDFRAIEGRPPAKVRDVIDRLVTTLSEDPYLRAVVTTAADGDDSDDHLTLERLLPDPAQREVVRRALALLDTGRTS